MKLGPEYYESVLLADWLERVARVLFTHIPSGEDRPHKIRIDRRSGRQIRYSPAGIKLRRMGLRPGFPDYLILDYPPVQPTLHGALVELKAKIEDGGKPPTDAQLSVIAGAQARGYAARWFYGADAAIAWLKSLGYGPR